MTKNLSENVLIRKILLVSLPILLTGCVSGYSKPGGTYQEYFNTRLECMKVAAGPYCVNSGLFNSCMLQKGWSEDSGGFKPPSNAVVSTC